MFSQVSVCPIASWDTHTPLGRHSPGRHPPSWAGRHPPRADPPLGRHSLGRQPPGHTPPPRSTCWDTVNKRAVRIPLECILVLYQFRNDCLASNVCMIVIYDEGNAHC